MKKKTVTRSNLPLNHEQAICRSFLVFFNPLLFAVMSTVVSGQDSVRIMTDVNTPLHAMQPDYDIPYVVPEPEDVKKVLDKIYNYLDEVTPPKIMDQRIGKEIEDLTKLDSNSWFMPGDFRLCSYEWGVTYAGMLLAGEVTGDSKYTGYTVKRLEFLGKVAGHYRSLVEKSPGMRIPVRSILEPRALDDAGAMCAAMIKTRRAGLSSELQPMIDNYIDFISYQQFRLSDGTLARNRPLPNTIWLDDLFMSVPALAQMGKLTGEEKYYDDAVSQILQFTQRMYNYEKNLFMHGWVQDMEPHPQFHWARANGWAVMAMIELLDVLPEDHRGRELVMKVLRAHVSGLAACQSGKGFWHQLLDRRDSYLETSATAIYTYSIARAINKGYVDEKAYGPMVLLAWNAVSTKVNSRGQVEGTCVGTGMAFDPAFYYYRPISVYAAHGYGPVLLAGAEVLSLLKNFRAEINDSALMMYKKRND
ncbi:MAG: glycoside hydrolase family 88 protein [Bacteroidales bacterium]|nr:glycoside hydrolase family 88 protein [Bacteroidales bacterium]